MKPKSSRCAMALRPVVAWAGVAILSLGALFGATNALAAAPAANLLIGNQATASYIDVTGASQLTTSNLVQTTVQQVGSFTLDGISTVGTTVINTKTGAGGNVVYAAHVLTNTGNGTDNFTMAITNGPGGVGTAGMLPVQVFLDADFNGLPDSTTPLCTAPAGSTCSVAAPQTVAGSGGRLGFVVAYSIPAGAGPAAPYSSATITATAATPALYAAGNTSVANVDQVNVSNLAAFNATKTLAIPTVAGPGNTTYPAATQTGQRSASASCLATYAGASAPAPGCVYSTYTILFQNTGGAAGAFYMNDVLPAGFTYVTGSAVWSGASGVALDESSAEATPGIDFQQTGQQVSARIATVNASVASSISFMVMVNSTATVGVGSTSNTATYDPGTTAKTAALSGAGTASTNASAFTVTASYGVTLGSSIGVLPGSTDTVAGTPNGAFGTAGVDQNLAASITSGSSVKFTHNVFNTGNAADTFNMTVFANTFPANSTFAFYQADGVTPLLDTNLDGVVDTGIIGAAGSAVIVVRATIPASVAPAAGPFTLTARATSVGNALLFDASGNQVTTVTGALVDLTNSVAGTGAGSVGSGDLGAGPSPSPTTTNTTPAGTGTVFSLYIKNNDSIAQTYNLSASQTPNFPGSLPAGWTVKFVTTGGTCASIAITTTSSVPAGQQLAINACVTPPTSAVAGTTNVYFRATSATSASNNVIINDTITDAVTVTVATTYSATLTPSNSGQVNQSGTVVYAHTLNNTGAQACGAYTLSTTQSKAGSGWTVALFLDVNGNGVIDSTDTPVTGSIAGPLAVGGSQKILARVFAPGGTTIGEQDTVVVTATFTDAAPNCGAPSATDVSTVVSGQIRVVKNQSADANCDGTPDNGAFAATMITSKPGECVIYEVTATNEGIASIANLVINDALPRFTSLTGAIQPTVQCTASAGVTGTAPVYASTGTTVSCGSAANSVTPGSTLKLSFAVRLNP